MRLGPSAEKLHKAAIAGGVVDTTRSTAAFTQIVRGIQAGDPAGMEELCSQFLPGLQFFFTRGLGHRMAPDLARSALSAAAGAIQRGELPDPLRLPGLIRTIARRMVENVSASVKPEIGQLDRATVEVAATVLNSLPARAQEMLKRFYLQKQGAEQVCSEMKLSPAQFCSLKSRAKKEFEARLKRQPVRQASPLAGPACAARGASSGSAS